MSSTVENKTFITNRSVDESESKRAMGAGILEMINRNVSIEAMLLP
jgi:hypothetical protein